MKKIVTFLLIGMLILASMSALVGCNGDKPVDSQDPGSDPAAVLNLVENGVSEYRIVIPDSAPRSVQSQAIALRRAIEAITGVQLQLVNDWENKDDNANIKEILIGDTNRAASVEVAAAMGDKDVAIVNSGNKLVLLGRTDALVELAVQRFLASYAGYVSADEYEKRSTLSIPEDLKDFSERDIVLYIANEELSYVNELKAQLEKSIGNIKVVPSDGDVSKVFSSALNRLVIVAGIENFSYEAQNALKSYLNEKGRVLMLGGPAYEKPFRWYGEAVTLNEYRENVINDLDDDHMQILLSATELKNMEYVKDSASGEAEVSVGNYELKGSLRQLCYKISHLTNYALLQSKSNLNVNLDKANVISFYAKAADDITPAFTLLVEDKDDCEWRLKVPVSADEWRHCSFIPEDFTLNKGTSASGTLDLANISRIKIEFDYNYSKISQSAHGIYLSDILLANVEDDAAFQATSNYNLNGVTPLYEQYPITNAADISADASQVFVSDRNYVIPTGTNTLVSRYPGITASGYDKDTDVRFIPLLTAVDANGLVSGYVAWLDLYSSHTMANKTMEGSMVGYFGATTDEFYNADGIAAVVETATAMTRNAFIIDGGTTEFTYVDAETDAITAGIKYVTLNGSSSDELVAAVSLYKGDKLLKQYSSNNSVERGFSNSIVSIEGRFDLSGDKPDRVVATLSVGGEIVDRIEHSVHFWAPKPESERSFVYIEDGYFKKDGEIINFFGINYYPAYNGAGLDDDTKDEMKKYTTTHQQWLSNGGYNRDVLLNDLKRIKSLGMNAISTQVRSAFMEDCNNVLDFLRICDEMGIYVDIVTTVHSYPLRGYNPAAVEIMIDRLHLNEMDIVISYDIAYEERIGTYEGGGGGAINGRFIGRKQWDADFTAWVKVQYGSLAEAQKAWGTSIPLTDGNLIITDAMLDDTTGKYHKVVAAYQRFIDDIVGTQMQKNLSHIQSVAPNQLISFRMSMSGSTLRAGNQKPSAYCYDFQSLASSMDFMQPEGYELAATDKSNLQVMFANAYARYTKPDAPIVMKEYGKTIWPYRDDANFYPNPASTAIGAMFYEYALEYCYRSYTSGMFCWWSIAGYRLGEDSDYGIFNPDGSDREGITDLMREYAVKFITQGERKDTVYIEVERDDYTDGLFGMFDAVKDQLAAAYKAGKSVTFIDKSQNTDGSYKYADTLLNEYVADAKTASGTAPLRYINGIIKSFDVVTEGGKTYAEVTICNTKQSIWRADTVSLVSTDASDVAIDCTIDEQVDYLEDVTLKFEIKGKGDVALRFEIGGVQFGPLFSSEIK